MSGNNVVSGWFCSAALSVTIQFDDAPPVEVPYGGQRNDTIPVCGDANNGYASIFPYAALGPGLHRLRVRADGEVRADITFTVVTFGLEFLSGVTGEGTITLSNGQGALVEWSEAVQGFIVVAVTDRPVGDFSGTWLHDLGLSSNTCTAIATVELDFTFVGTFEIIQMDSGSIVFVGAPGFAWTGDVDSNGDFVVFRSGGMGNTGSCLFDIRDTLEGNFFTGVITQVIDFGAIMPTVSACSGAAVPCSVGYAGSISPASDLSLEEKGQSLPMQGWRYELTTKLLQAIRAVP